MSGTIEERLLAAGVSQKALDAAKDKSTKEGISFMYAVEQLKPMPEDVLLKTFGAFYNVQIAELQKMDIPSAIIQLIPAEIAEKARLIPIDRAGNNIIVAMSNPSNTQAAYSIRFATGYAIKPVLASETQITAALKKYYAKKKVKEFKKGEFDNTQGATKKPATSERFNISDKKSGADGPIIKLVNDLMVQCIEKGGSDIHIEPYETYVRVRMRVDGTLTEAIRPPIEVKDALTSRIKIMAGMDISEKRLPQDGGIRALVNDTEIDFRVNSLPTIYGEKIVMRILDRSALQVDMTKLGFEGDDLEKFMDAIHKPFGMVLVTGPTGSGKTTTLYSALSELNKESENIMTAEDPVEYNLEGINQVQIKADIELDFSAALRAFLRQDPDIIMVGEIRDLATAEIAIKAALTGHLVLSTLHTNSAAETIIRIKNMGVEPFNIASALNAVIAQRLAKRICTKCRVIDELVTPEVLVELGIHPSYASRVKAYKGAGCDTCGHTGNKGRVALHEVLLVSDPIREAIFNSSSAMDLKRVAITTGMRTLRQAALNKMVQGIIDSREVIRNTTSDTSENSSEAA